MKMNPHQFLLYKALATALDLRILFTTTPDAI